VKDMNGIIIVNQQAKHSEYKITRFVEEFAKANISLDVFVNDGTLAEISNGETKINLPDSDFIIYLDKDIYLARMLEKAGRRIFNKADFIKLCDDKMLTFIACANKGIRMPDTLAAPLVYTSNNNPSVDFLDNVISKLGFPMVVKKVYGSLGEGVYLANDKNELITLYKQICHSPILFQKYVGSSSGKSIRVIVINGKVFGAFIRKNKGDFRSNFGESAGSEKLENNTKYAQFAAEIAEKLEIEYAGIDLLDDENGEPVLCEINSNAFFEEFEKVTNLNVAEAYRDMIIEKVSNHE
jgi:RimK family alpha-L-glutamate ligase